MKRLFIGATMCLVAGLSANSAEAANLSCSGSHLGYQFGLTAKTQGSRVVGPVVVNISQGGRAVKRSSLNATSSNIVPGQSLQLAASGADGSGQLEARYSGGSYSGTLVAATSRGTFNVVVGCALSGTGFEANEAIEF